MVKYSDMAEVVWTLNQYTYAYDMEVALSALQHLGGNTNTADALQKTREEIYMTSQGGNRTDARDVIVLMTDGLSTRRQHDVKVRGAECRAYYVTLSAKSSLILGENKTFRRECLIMCLLPAGSEEHEVLQTGSIHVTILPSCRSFTIFILRALVVHLFG